MELANELDLVVNWYLLGVNLGAHELATIEEEYRGHNEQSEMEMLVHWLQNAKHSTWKAVADALNEMGEHEVALKIWNKYCSSFTVTGMHLLCLFELQISYSNFTYLSIKSHQEILGPYLYNFMLLGPYRPTF